MDQHTRGWSESGSFAPDLGQPWRAQACSGLPTHAQGCTASIPRINTTKGGSRRGLKTKVGYAKAKYVKPEIFRLGNALAFEC